MKYTRAMISAALNGELDNVKFVHNRQFNLDVPVSCPGVPAEILDPRATWKDRDAYDLQANQLAALFEKNFAEKYPDIDPAIADAGPRQLVEPAGVAV